MHIVFFVRNELNFYIVVTYNANYCNLQWAVKILISFTKGIEVDIGILEPIPPLTNETSQEIPRISWYPNVYYCVELQ
jgi:hypothetical protein